MSQAVLDGVRPAPLASGKAGKTRRSDSRGPRCLDQGAGGPGGRVPGCSSRAVRRSRGGPGRLHPPSVTSRPRAARPPGSRAWSACTRGDRWRSSPTGAAGRGDTQHLGSSSSSMRRRGRPWSPTVATLSGKWSFSSGCDHCSWVSSAGWSSNAEGNVVDKTFMVPREGLHDRRRLETPRRPLGTGPTTSSSTTSSSRGLHAVDGRHRPVLRPGQRTVRPLLSCRSPRSSPARSRRDHRHGDGAYAEHVDMHAAEAGTRGVPG